MIGALAGLAGKALLTPTGLITAGLAATQLPAIQDSIRDSIVERGPKGGEFRKGLLGNLFMVGDQKDLQERFAGRIFENVEGANILERAKMGDIIDPTKSLQFNRRAIQAALPEAQSKLRRKEEERDLDSPRTQFMLKREDNKMDKFYAREDAARRNELELRRDTMMGQQDLQRLQLMNIQDQNREKMDLYRQQLDRKSADDRYRTTAALISGLANLGAAFTL